MRNAGVEARVRDESESVSVRDAQGRPRGPVERDRGAGRGRVDLKNVSPNSCRWPVSL